MFSSLSILLLSVAAAVNGVKIGGRILGGEVADISSYPYQVQVGVVKSHRSGSCGGSIIGENWVLTAAHCLPENTILVIVRDHTNTAWVGGNRHTVDKYYIHDEFKDGSIPNVKHRNDIALVHVIEPFSTDYIIKMWEPREEIPVGSTAVASGYGISKKYGNVGDRVFRVVEIPIISEEECKRPYSGMSVHIDESTICAGIFGIEKSGCLGDSGGPLVVDGRLAGIFSFHYGCENTAEYPGGYVKVSYYREWIQKKMDEYHRMISLIDGLSEGHHYLKKKNRTNFC